jgi:hypothetical protein
MTAAEGRAGDILSYGHPVPGHPGACADPDCWHGLLWHERYGARPCTIPGCECIRWVQPPVRYTRRNKPASPA